MPDEDKVARSEQSKKTKLVIPLGTQKSSNHSPVPELKVSPAPDHGQESFSAPVDDISIEDGIRTQELSKETLPEFAYGEPYPSTANSPFDVSSISEDTDLDGDIGPEDDDSGQDLIFPTEISYELKVICDGLVIDPLRKTLSLNDLGGYGKIKQQSIKLINKSYQVPPTLDCLHFSGGHCIEVRDNEPRPQYAIASSKQWQNMCRKLLKDFASGGSRHCELSITFVYFVLRLEPTDLDEASDSDEDEDADVNKAAPKDSKRQQLRLAHKVRAMLKENINGQEYLSEVDFNAVTSPQLVRAVVNNCKSLTRLTEAEKDKLSQAIDERAKKLFIMFVLDQTYLKCLKKLLDNGFHDNDLRKRENQTYVCCSRHKTQPDTLAQRPLMFSVFRFKPREHFNLRWNCVIPVMPVAVDQSERASNLSTTPTSAASSTKQESITPDQKRKAPATLGEGAHSQVYLVRVDPSHNRISKNRDELFALKEITSKHRPSREESMLDEINSYRSPHLTKRLVSWTQGNKHCILFPLAECNLANYMKREKFGNGENNIIWLLEQFLGLAGALGEIHTPKSNREEQISSIRHARSSSGEQQLSPSGGGQDSSKLKGLYVAWHHDVKPQNILYFSNTDTKQRSFQLCDYGSSKINKCRSHSDPTATHRGTPTYEPPETALGSLSRPSDTWALGCVFLEIVTWAIDGYQGVESFREARWGRPIIGSATTDDGFWVMLLDKSIILREKVTDHIQSLKDKAQDSRRRLFLGVLDLITMMLQVEKDLRVKMATVRQDLLNIVAVAKANMEQNPAAFITGGVVAYAGPTTSDMSFRPAGVSPQRAPENSPPRSPKKSRTYQN